MKLLLAYFMTVSLFSVQSHALSERARRILGKEPKAAKVAKDYLVVRCEYVNVLDGRTLTGKTILLKQSVSPGDKYDGSDFMRSESFKGYRTSDFEMREIEGHFDFDSANDGTRESLFKSAWGDSHHPKETSGKVNSSGHFTVYLDGTPSGRRLLITTGNPKISFVVKDDLLKRIPMQCQLFTLPTKPRTPSSSPELASD